MHETLVSRAEIIRCSWSDHGGHTKKEKRLIQPASQPAEQPASAAQRAGKRPIEDKLQPRRKKKGKRFYSAAGNETSDLAPTMASLSLVLAPVRFIRSNLAIRIWPLGLSEHLITTLYTSYSCVLAELSGVRQSALNLTEERAETRLNMFTTLGDSRRCFRSSIFREGSATGTTRVYCGCLTLDARRFAEVGSSKVKIFP